VNELTACVIGVWCSWYGKQVTTLRLQGCRPVIALGRRERAVRLRPHFLAVADLGVETCTLSSRLLYLELHATYNLLTSHGILDTCFRFFRLFFSRSLKSDHLHT
jgi:hypothetical protein